MNSFGNRIFLQKKGGPIGMRFPGSLANLIMKMWDQKWVDLMAREGVKHELYVRYVDYCRLVMPALNRGWVLEGTQFVYKEEDAKLEVESDANYTTTLVTKAMCSLVNFLKFIGEDESMLESRKLPTLDTEL